MIPRTPLSFLYHITEAAPYRDEMHHDMRQAFRRFEIAEVLRPAAFNVERASFEQRVDEPEELTVPLDVATDMLFLGIVPALDSELQLGTDAEDQPVKTAYDDPRMTLLHATYLLFYSRAYRDEHPEPPAVAGPPYAKVDLPAFAESWSFIRDALRKPVGMRPSPAQTTPHLARMMRSLAAEFAGGIWAFCW